MLSNRGSMHHHARLRPHAVHLSATTAIAEVVARTAQAVPAKLVITRSGVFVGMATADERIEAKMAAVVFMVLGSELVMVPMCGRKGMEGRGGGEGW